MFPPSPSAQGRRLLLGVAHSKNPLAVELVIPILKPVTPIGVLSPKRHTEKAFIVILFFLNYLFLISKIVESKAIVVCVVLHATGQIRHLLCKSDAPLTSPRLVLKLQAKSIGVNDLFIGVSDCRTKTWHGLHLNNRLCRIYQLFQAVLPQQCLNQESIYITSCRMWCHVSTKLYRTLLVFGFVSH